MACQVYTVWIAKLLSLDSLVFQVQTVWFVRFRHFGLLGFDSLVCQLKTVWFAWYRQFGLSGLDSLVFQVQTVWFASFRQFGLSFRHFGLPGIYSLDC